VLAESAVKDRATHHGQVHQLADVGSLVGREAQRELQRIVRGIDGGNGAPRLLV
jgi:hypothetical protein